MRTNDGGHRFLYLGLGLSLLLHLAIGYPLFMKKWPHEKKSRYPLTMVSVQIVPKMPEKKAQVPVSERPQPAPVAAPKPQPSEKPKKKPAARHQRQTPPKMPKTTPTQQQAPAADNRKADPHPLKEDPKTPVFGITSESTMQTGESALSVPVGNTLMKPQEQEFTPADQVKRYQAVPGFELSSMPAYKTKVAPQYPETLKAAEVQGEVLLAVTIDEQGKVVAIHIKRSDHDLFSKAAEAALKRCTFTPGMKNGMPVTTVIDIPIKFVLDE